MRLTPLRRSGLLGAATVAAVATLALVTTAFAQPTKPAPVSGDERAVAYAGNVDIEHKDACTVGGLTGTPIAPSEFTFTGGVNQQDLDIIVAPLNVTITGVVVKGSDAYNVYLAAKLGATPPWLNLRAPDNNGGNVPAISHWYACGIKKDQSSSSTTTTTTSTSSSSASTTTTTAGSSESSTVAPTTTTTTVAVVPVADEGVLASTGFGSAWLVGLGAALLAAGVAVLFVLRRRRA
jgi:LPXTG-motif cell wall-anchored protein